MNKLKNFDIFKLSIAASLLIVAFSIAYYLVIFLPSQLEIQNDTVKSPITAPTPIPTESASKKSNTLNLLNQCLDNARIERERVSAALLKLSDEGQPIHKSAFESNDKQYERDRQDCFSKYPQ